MLHSRRSKPRVWYAPTRSKRLKFHLCALALWFAACNCLAATWCAFAKDPRQVGHAFMGRAQVHVRSDSPRNDAHSAIPSACKTCWNLPMANPFFQIIYDDWRSGLPHRLKQHWNRYRWSSARNAKGGCPSLLPVHRFSRIHAEVSCDCYTMFVSAGGCSSPGPAQAKPAANAVAQPGTLICSL